MTVKEDFDENKGLLLTNEITVDLMSTQALQTTFTNCISLKITVCTYVYCGKYIQKLTEFIHVYKYTSGPVLSILNSFQVCSYKSLQVS